MEVALGSDKQVTHSVEATEVVAEISKGMSEASTFI